MSEVWPDTVVEENNLNKNISTLRQVLGEVRGQHKFIATVPGRGYKFIAAVTEITDATLIKDGDFSTGERQRTVAWPKAAAILVGVCILGVIGIAWLLFRIDRPAAGTSNGPKTLAILPFRPLVPSNDDAALEIAMADALISRFGGNTDIIVRPLSSVQNFAVSNSDAVSAGRDLKVESVLEGTIQRWGDKIRVNVRLVNVSDGRILWSGVFDEKFTDVLNVQDIIAVRVTQALELHLGGGDQTRFDRRSTKDPEAYALYIRGHYNVLKITEPSIRKGIEFYQQAIQADPQYALAYAGLADAYRTMTSVGFAPGKNACPQAKDLANKAKELDETLAEPHIVLGWTGFLCDWNWKAAEVELKRAIEIDPNNSEAHRAYAHLLSNWGRHDEAMVEAKKATELAPMTMITLILESQFQFYAGLDEEALIQAKKAMEFDPDFWVAHNLLGRVYARQQKYADAVTEFNKAVELSGGGAEPLMQLGYTLAASGKQEEARDVLARMRTGTNGSITPRYNLAMVHNGLGEATQALELLEESLSDREIQLAFIEVDKRWDNLRSEPRFGELLRRMNIIK